MKDAEVIAEIMKPSGSKVAWRNRLIKKALASKFGYANVSVKGDRGTAYGWVNIKIRDKKPHEGECDWRCHLCRDKRAKITQEVWKILVDLGIYKKLSTWWDDMGVESKECIITVDLN